jgi:hypothetical protein
MLHERQTRMVMASSFLAKWHCSQLGMREQLSSCCELAPRATSSQAVSRAKVTGKSSNNTKLHAARVVHCGVHNA